MTKMPVLDKNLGISNILSAKGLKSVSSPLEDFGAVLKQTNGTGAENAVGDKKAEAVNAAEQGNETKGNALRDKLNGKDKVEKETDTAKTEETGNAADTEDIEENAEVLERAGGEMVSALAAQMNIPEETVRETMEEMQLSDVSLLQPENVKELMVSLTEGADSMSMLTDSSFYDSVTQALETLEDITDKVMDETGMSFEEIQTAAADLKWQEAEDEVSEKEVPESAVRVQEENKEPVKLPVEKPELSETTRTETVMPKEAHKQESRGKESEHSYAQDQFQNPTAGEQVQTERMGETGRPLPMISTQEIMDQIMDYMKVSVKPELSNLEMQLHPESLGNLHIHISSKEGVVTAQFTAQNETVRAVLESQMMELKQNLEEQGVKVEAVEVTIAQYSLDREPEGNEASTGQGQKQKKGVRNLNLKELDAEEEELTEEEKLAAEMMRSEGSTISYTA